MDSVIQPKNNWALILNAQFWQLILKLIYCKVGCGAFAIVWSLVYDVHVIRLPTEHQGVTRNVRAF